MPFDIKYEAKGIISRGYSCFKIIENFKKFKKFRKVKIPCCPWFSQKPQPTGRL